MKAAEEGKANKIKIGSECRILKGMFTRHYSNGKMTIVIRH